MRKLLYIAFSFTIMFAGIQGVHAQTKDTAKKAAPKESDELIYYTEPMPEFPGGNEAMKKWIKAQVQYPKEALAKGVKGAVFVEVNVMKDGSLSNISIVFGIGSGCDEEALRIAKAMPKWKPGLKNAQSFRFWSEIFRPSVATVMCGEDEGLPDVDGGIYVTMPMLLRIRGRRRSLTFTTETLQHAVDEWS